MPDDADANRPGVPDGPILSPRGLDKRFTGTHVLKSINLDFLPGEIHAIIGENGAGKSTLIKLLTGVYPRSAGEIFWQGAAVALDTPHDAIALGINAVHQEVVLCRHLTHPPAARAGCHHRLYQPPAGGSFRNCRPRLHPA
jgi:ribose transport system ATP-binding protein